MTTPMTVAGLLSEARAMGLSRLDAQVLLGGVLRCSRSWLIAHGEDAVDETLLAPIRQAFQARAQGMPVAYLVGEREFHGLRLRVTPDVLDPRPDTETLVDWALEILQTLDGEPDVADLGTGSGAIALAIQAACPGARVTGVDSSPRGLAVAADNGERLGLPVRWKLGRWFEPLAGSRFDLIVSNPPYIREGDPHLAALHAEPREALVAGPDGLSDLRELCAGAARHLKPGGWLLLEHGHDQGCAVHDLLLHAGLESISSRTDLEGHIRCTGARIPHKASGKS